MLVVRWQAEETKEGDRPVGTTVKTFAWICDLLYRRHHVLLLLSNIVYIMASIDIKRARWPGPQAESEEISSNEALKITTSIHTYNYGSGTQGTFSYRWIFCFTNGSVVLSIIEIYFVFYCWTSHDMGSSPWVPEWIKIHVCNRSFSIRMAAYK